MVSLLFSFKEAQNIKIMLTSSVFDNIFDETLQIFYL